MSFSQAPCLAYVFINVCWMTKGPQNIDMKFVLILRFFMFPVNLKLFPSLNFVFHCYNTGTQSPQSPSLGWRDAGRGKFHYTLSFQLSWESAPCLYYQYLRLFSSCSRLIGSDRAVRRKCPWRGWQAFFSVCRIYLSGLSVPNAIICSRVRIQLHIICIRNTRGQLPGRNDISASLIHIPEASSWWG